MRTRSLLKRFLFVLATCCNQLKIEPLPLPEGVAARRLCHPRGPHGPANLCLNDRAHEVVATLLPTSPRFLITVKQPTDDGLVCRRAVLAPSSPSLRITGGGRGGSSQGQQFLPPILRPNQGQGLALLKVAVHSIPGLAVQFLQAGCLRVNGGADGAAEAYGNPP